VNFGILVEAMIGPTDREGEEAFDFMLCTPQWIAHELQTRDRRWGRATLLVSEYSYEVLERTVARLCQRVEGSDWSQVAEVLSRWMQWEFEDYREALKP
jgi:immunity protein 8 of polymorphic toxin system